MKKVIKFFALMAAIALILPGISIFALEDNGNYDDVDNSTVSNFNRGYRCNSDCCILSCYSYIIEYFCIFRIYIILQK